MVEGELGRNTHRGPIPQGAVCLPFLSPVRLYHSSPASFLRLLPRTWFHRREAGPEVLRIQVTQFKHHWAFPDSTTPWPRLPTVPLPLLVSSFSLRSPTSLYPAPDQGGREPAGCFPDAIVSGGCLWGPQILPYRDPSKPFLPPELPLKVTSSGFLAHCVDSLLPTWKPRREGVGHLKSRVLAWSLHEKQSQSVAR